MSKLLATVDERARSEGDRSRGTMRQPTCRSWMVAVCGVAVLLSGTAVQAASPTNATSSKAAREDAINCIPFERLDPALKDQVVNTVSNATIYRRLPVQVTDCDPDLYLFMVRHPEVVVNIWEIMRISNVALQKTSPNLFSASDGAGTTCQVKFCFSDFDTHVIYAESVYDGPLFAKPIKAQCVLVLKSGYVQETNGRHYVTSRMDTFIHIENAGVELLAKTLQMLIHRSADYNFIETAAFLGTVSRTAEVNPAGMKRLAVKLTNCEPHVRERFGELAGQVGQRARERETIQTSAVEPINSNARRVAQDR